MIIYTCLCGNIDKIHEPPDDGNTYICFTDQIINSKKWDVRPLVQKFRCNRLTARYHKTLVASQFKESTLWIDAKIKLKKEISFNKDHLVLATHPNRKCAYKEADQCLYLAKDNFVNISNITNVLKTAKFPYCYGLFETSVVYRDHTQQNILFNEIWWEHILISIRDQISLPYILWKLNIKPSLFNFEIFNNEFFDVEHHKITKIML